MKNTYLIKKRSIESENSWDGIEAVKISNFPWDDNGYRPKAFARAYHTDDALYVRLNAFEKHLRAVYGLMNEPVYTDSCLEFFISPDLGSDDRYLNFEINPLGTLLLGLGSNRHGRTLLEPAQVTKLNITTYTKKTEGGREWGYELCIPYEFLRSIFPGFTAEPNKQMRGNFYKCGDNTEFPHYGCWNPITLENPDFHCPDFFGTLILE